MYGFGGLLARRVYQAEHLPTAFIELVCMVMYLVLPLDLQIFIMGFCHGLSCESFSASGVHPWGVGCGILRVQLNASV
jgi:hypothetical protein